MATKAQTLTVNVIYDAPTNTISGFSGNCDPDGKITVNAGWVNTITFFVVTTFDPVNPMGAPAVMQDMGLPEQPTWLSSNPQPQGQNPGWILTASNGKDKDSTIYRPFVGPPGQPPVSKDPTIVNVDPPPPAG